MKLEKIKYKFNNFTNIFKLKFAFLNFALSKIFFLLSDDSSAQSEELNYESDNEWYYEQKLNTEESIESPLGEKYGFGGNSSGGFKKLVEELHELFEVKDPENKTMSQRHKERITFEKSQFSEDHYLADLYENEPSIEAIQFIPEFYSITNDEVCLNELECEEMMKLPRKRHLLDKGKQTNGVYLGMVDLIFSWCYNHRITKGENCSESPWNLRKLSSTLSWLESFDGIKDVVVACTRRSLIYPLIRNWKLSIQVLKDTRKVISLGQKQVLKCLLEMQRIFNSEHPHYILNELYITDYCIWIQQIKDAKLIQLSDDMREIEIVKTDAELELDELEDAAQMVLNEEQIDSLAMNNVNDVTDDLHSLSIIENSMATNFNENNPSPFPLNGYIKADSNHNGAVSDGDSDSDSDSESSSSDEDSSSSSSEDSEEDSNDDSSSELDSDDNSD